MKLLMENWNNYLTEQQFRDEFIQYITENNITLTEEQLNEVNWGALAKRFGGMAGLKRAAAKAGGVAALLAALGGGGTAQAQDTGPMDDPFAAFQQELDADMMKSMQGGDSSQAQIDPNARLYAASLLKQFPDLKGKSIFLDSNGAVPIEMSDIIVALNAIGVKASGDDSGHAPDQVPDYFGDIYPEQNNVDTWIHKAGADPDGGGYKTKGGERFDVTDQNIANYRVTLRNLK